MNREKLEILFVLEGCAKTAKKVAQRSVLRGNLEGTHCGPKTAASSFTQPKNQKTYEYSLYRIQFDKFFFLSR